MRRKRVQKFIFVLFLICLALSCAFAENTRKVTATHYYEGNPKKEMTFYDENGREIAKEFFHIDGRVMGVKGCIPNGEIFEYYGNGRLKSKAIYQSNFLYEETEYYATGMKKSSTDNEWSGRNLLKSTYTIFYPNGVMQQQIIMDSLGNGTSKLYYDSGELYEDALLEDAYRNGPITRYYKNGKKMLTGTMKDDMLDGIITEYDSNGKILHKVRYQDDEAVENVK